MGIERSIKLRTDLSVSELRSLFPIVQKPGFQEPVDYLAGTGTMINVKKYLPDYYWACRFEICWNTSVMIDYHREEDTTPATNLVDTAIGNLVRATEAGWVQHLDLPLLYWNRGKTVVNSDYHNSDALMRSLSDAGLSYESAEIDYDAGSVEELAASRWINGVYQRQGTGPYFNAEVADRWDQKWWGWPGFAAQHLGIPVKPESMVFFKDASASPELRQEVAAYLRAAQNALAVQQPPPKCNDCDEMLSPHYQWDGLWFWPEALAHDVEAHNFIVPNELVDRIRLLGSPPEMSPTGPDTTLPWPNVDAN